MKVILNEKASIFHDAYLGITIKKGETYELKSAMLQAPSIKRAINGGFLIRVAEESNTGKSLAQKFSEMAEAGVSADKLKKTFNLAQLKEIAEANGLEVEADDTKDSIIEALLEEGEEAEGETSKE